MNIKTQKIKKLALKIAEYASKQKLKYMIGGGVALGLANGKLYRNHSDLDFYPLDKDTYLWKKFFRNLGLTIELPDYFDDYPYAFVAYDSSRKSKVVCEVFPIKITSKGTIAVMWRGVGYGDFWDKTKSSISQVTFEGKKIFVESSKTVLTQKLIEAKKEGKELRKKDLLDFEIANIDPKELKKSIDFDKYS